MNTGKYLVVSGDDFGVSHAINLGVVQAFRQGIVSTAGIIAAGPWFEEAVVLARRYEIPIGVHLTVSVGTTHFTYGPLTRAPELTRDRKGYAFVMSPQEIREEHADIVLREATAQIERVLDAGLEPMYVDGHMDGIPRPDGAFAGTLTEIYRQYGIPFRGLPKEAPPETPYLRLRKYLLFSRNRSAEEKKQWLFRQLEELPEGVSFMHTHPATDPEDIDAQGGVHDNFRGATWRTDLEVLCDPDVADRLQQMGIRVIDCGEAFAICQRELTGGKV